MMDRPFNALVIDDEQQVRDFVCTVLASDGWIVSRAASAEDAFEMLSDTRWAIVFCDVMLGGADGFAVLKRFKAELPDAKIVLMTGHGSAAGALDATAFGAYDYILKPFGAEELQSLSAALREHLISRPQRLSGRPRAVAPHPALHLNAPTYAFIEHHTQPSRVAPTTLPLFLTGESRTRKQL